MSNQRKVRRIRGVVVVCGLMAAFSLIGGCHHDEGEKPALQGAAPAATRDGKQDFGIATAGSRVVDGRSELILTFTAPLVDAQAFDERIVVTGPNGNGVTGSWTLEHDRKTLTFPFVHSPSM